MNNSKLIDKYSDLPIALNIVYHYYYRTIELLTIIVKFMPYLKEVSFSEGFIQLVDCLNDVSLNGMLLGLLGNLYIIITL